MDWAGAFAEIASGFTDSANGPFVAAKVLTNAPPVLDDGGSIVTPGALTERDCLVQADYAGEAMRADAGFADGDIRILVLSATLSGAITTDDRVRITTGPFAGLWSVQSVSRDPAAIGWELRGRRG